MCEPFSMNFEYPPDRAPPSPLGIFEQSLLLPGLAGLHDKIIAAEKRR